MSKGKDKFANERAIFLEHIQAAGLRRTDQRELIMETFLGTEEHLTIEDLHRLVQKKGCIGRPYDGLSDAAAADGGGTRPRGQIWRQQDLLRTPLQPRAPRSYDLHGDAGS